MENPTIARNFGLLSLIPFAALANFLGLRLPCAVSGFEKAQSAAYENLRVLRFFVVNILLISRLRLCCAPNVVVITLRKASRQFSLESVRPCDNYQSL